MSSSFFYTHRLLLRVNFSEDGEFSMVKEIVVPSLIQGSTLPGRTET